MSEGAAATTGRVHVVDFEYGQPPQPVVLVRELDDPYGIHGRAFVVEHENGTRVSVDIDNLTIL